MTHLEEMLQHGRAASLKRGELVRSRLIIDGTGLGLSTLRCDRWSAPLFTIYQQPGSMTTYQQLARTPPSAFLFKDDACDPCFPRCFAIGT